MTDPKPFELDRHRMIERQLRGRGITSEAVLEAMSNVPRDQFVARHLQAKSYADSALPIDCEQAISQPYMVAIMTQLLRLERSHRVLEIGTGSGYQTAILAELCNHVVTIERHEPLFRLARERLHRLGYRQVECRCGDGYLGDPQDRRFDRILVTAAASHCPPTLLEQLADGGILVGPFGPPDVQMLQSIAKSGNSSVVTSQTRCRFVPLVEGVARSR